MSVVLVRPVACDFKPEASRPATSCAFVSGTPASAVLPSGGDPSHAEGRWHLILQVKYPSYLPFMVGMVEWTGGDWVSRHGSSYLSRLGRRIGANP